MFDPFITSVNTERAALTWFDSLVLNASNLYTPGFRERKAFFSDFLTGTQVMENSYKSEQGKSYPGRAPSNLFIEGKGWFVVRKPDGKQYYTRMGDFHFNDKGTMVSETGYKLQGYITDDKGNIIGGTNVQNNNTGSPNNPSQKQGGPGFAPTTDVTMWLDPTNGKFFGKFDEYKIKADGLVVGVANNGKTQTPLYRVALVNFVNPNQLVEAEDNYFLPTELSGPPVEGSGEVRSGLIEKSNVDSREIINYMQFAKLQLDVTSKLINLNKTLLQESVRLLG